MFLVINNEELSTMMIVLRLEVLMVSFSMDQKFVKDAGRHYKYKFTRIFHSESDSRVSVVCSLSVHHVSSSVIKCPKHSFWVNQCPFIS